MKIKLLNFNIYISFTAIALFALIIISNKLTGYLYCFLSILVHEAGHLIAMFLCKCSPDSLEISVFNIKIVHNNRPNVKLTKDIFITLSGPLFNFLACLIFLNININFAYVNLFIGLFNLLPSKSLDGGQLLYLILSRYFLPKRINLIIDILTIIVSLPIFFVGTMILILSKYNFSLLFIGVYLIISVFLKDDKYL